MRKVSLQAGLSESAVKDLFNKGNVPSVENFAAICRAAGTTVEDILYGASARRSRVQIVGCASAGEAWEPFDDRLGDIEMAVAGEAVGIEVHGNSMFPAYRNGDVIIGEKVATTAIDNLIGLDCIVMTDNGERLIKVLTRGQKGTYRLESYNRAFEPIENVKLAWVAPIIWVRRSTRT